MMLAPAGTAVRQFELDGEAATERLAQRVAALARRGDAILLSGELGVGKTHFARAFIGCLAGEGVEVPSPSFTLVQCYETKAGSVWHFDLFRLRDPREILELGLEEAWSGGIALVEWPERAPGWMPMDRLEVELRYVSGAPAARRGRLAGHGTWAERLRRLDSP